MARCGLELVQSEYPDQLLLVSHHIDDTLEIPWTAQRALEYGVIGTPHVRIDGVFSATGATSCIGAAAVYRNLLEQRLQATGGLSPIEITGSAWIDASEVNLSATLTLVDNEPLPDLRGILLLMENGVIVGSTPFDRVTRAVHEEDVLLLNAGDDVTLETTFASAGAWDFENLIALAFVQDAGGNLEIHQSALLPIGSSGITPWPEAIAGRLSIASIAPNPVRAGHGVDLRIALTIPTGAPFGEIDLALVDAAGRSIRSFPERFLAAQELHVRWDGRDRSGNLLRSGAYWLRLTMQDQVVHEQLLCIR